MQLFHNANLCLKASCRLVSHLRSLRKEACALEIRNCSVNASIRLYESLTPRYVASELTFKEVAALRRGMVRRTMSRVLWIKVQLYLRWLVPATANNTWLLSVLTVSPKSSRRSRITPQLWSANWSSVALLKVAPTWKSSAYRVMSPPLSGVSNYSAARCKKPHMRQAHKMGAALQPCLTPSPTLMGWNSPLW